MGCFRRIGCLALIVLIAAAAWVFRADWLPLVQGGDRGRGAADSATTVVWEPATPEGAARARAAVRQLGSRTGPVYANLSPGDLTAYIFEELSKQLPPSAQQIESAIIDRHLWVRANIKLTDFGGADALGPLAGILGDREPVRFGGTIEIVQPGLAEYQVDALRFRELSVPSAVIPKLLRKSEHGARPAGLSDNALPLVVPRYIADVRIRNGKITLYKATR
jgi:hypothetical protein